MHGQMMEIPLLTSSLMRHAARHHPHAPIVSVRVEGDGRHRTDYARVEARARRLASAFERAGVDHGDRIGTMAWNGYRHLELYHGVGGLGCVIHTINPRLHPDQIVWIANDANDRYLAFDLSFAPIIEAIAPRLPDIRGFIAMTDAQHMPVQAKIPRLLCYEEFLESGDAIAGGRHFRDVRPGRRL